jgi:hypothetical protein
MVKVEQYSLHFPIKVWEVYFLQNLKVSTSPPPAASAFAMREPVAVLFHVLSIFSKSASLFPLST